MPGRVTIAQVAAAAGVSAMTVSNALNGRPGASETTRQRIVETAARLGYVPNLAARGLRGGRTGLIGVLALDLTSQYALEIVRGIADELAAVELELLISATYQDAGREKDRVAFMTSGHVDGVLLIAPALEPATVKTLRAVPTVVIDPRRLDLPLPRVTVTNYQGTRDSTQHIIDLGHREIAYIGGDPDFESSAERYRGYRDAMRLAGLPVDRRLVREADYSYDGGRRAATSLLKRHQPTAIVAAADLLALAAIDTARSLEMSVPHDLSIVGFDDLPQAAQSFPGLTTVRQPLHDMGATAVRMLLTRLESGRALTDHMKLPTSLVVRNSAVASAAHPAR
jgi:LacI family transcriptional regulator